MAEKRKPTPDLQRVTPFAYSTWLAGFLEVGASMKIEVVRNYQNGHFTPQARPEIAYGDSNPDRISTLKKLLGITNKTRKTESTSYAVIRSDRAAVLAHSIRLDAPSRQTMISAFIDWLQAQFTEERVEIAQRVAGRRTIDMVHPHDYSRLVSSKDFVGGIIDCRGRISPIEQPDRSGLSHWVSHRLKVNSVNGPLLEALQTHHGGQLIQVGKQGERVSINGVNVTLKNDLFELVLGADNTKRLLNWAKPKLSLSNAVGRNR